jgi:hypothetical protein
MNLRDVKTMWVEIQISGPLSVIEQTCRRVCQSGLCVTVSPTRFIYTGGEETGACVRLVNYPKYPTDPEALWQVAEGLADEILKYTHQDSVLLMSPDRTLHKTLR